MSVVVRERERDREYDSSRSTRRDEKKTYTTVRRYKVPDRDRDDDRREDRREETDVRIIRREREPDPEPEERETIREYRIERDRDRGGRRGDYRSDYRSERESVDDIREYRVSRDYDREPRSVRSFHFDRAPSPPQAVREYRVEREWDRDDRDRRPYDLERYSRSTEFFAQQPQPIIIRQDAPQPIIIREAAPQEVIVRRETPPEPAYELIEETKKKEIIEDVASPRSTIDREEEDRKSTVVSKRSRHAPSKGPEDDNYYYERKVTEVKRDDREDDRADRFRRDIRPRDSASNYSSEDDYYYEERKVRDRSSSRDPHHRRHLAEGAVVGALGAEALRHHRKSQGEDGGGRTKSLIGGAALGAVGAEAVTRARDAYREHESRSRSRRRRSRSRDRDRDRSSSSSRDGGRRRHRSRHRSHSRARTLAGVAGVAALGVLAGYAVNRSRKNKDAQVEIMERRSRSRHRPDSPGFVEEEQVRVTSPTSPHMDAGHRNRRIAQAGLASAAVAGLVERARSKSRDRKGLRSRSRSRIRQGVPIAAAGLGGAALAGLYERSKAKKEAHREEEVGRDFDPGMPDRSRSVPMEHMRGPNDGALVEYGGDPIYPAQREDDYYRQRSYEDPADYRRARRGSSASPPPGRSRSRSRLRDAAGIAGVAGAAGYAAHEATKRSERKRADRERRRREEEEAAIGEPYPGQGGYPAHEEYYPQNNAFPPPPGSGGYDQQQAIPPPEHHQYYDQQAAAGGYPEPAPYNPADYGPIGHQQPASAAHETYLGDNRYPAQPGASGPQGPGPAHNADNVSGEQPRVHFGPPSNNHDAAADHDWREDGLMRTRSSSAPPRQRHVQFGGEEFEPTPRRDTSDRSVDDEGSTNQSDRRRDTDRSEPESDHAPRSRDFAASSSGPESLRPNTNANSNPNPNRRPRTGRDSPTSDTSDATVELPPRFDSQGNRMPQRGDDPLTASIQDLLSGHGSAGHLFSRIAGNLF